MIILYIPITFSLNVVWILLGENWSCMVTQVLFCSDSTTGDWENKDFEQRLNRLEKHIFGKGNIMSWTSIKQPVPRSTRKWPLNSSSPNIHIQILQTGLYTFPLRISWENLLKDQSIFSLVIILLILITFSLDIVWISLGENWCWSLLGLKGFMEVGRSIEVHHRSA